MPIALFHYRSDICYQGDFNEEFLVRLYTLYNALPTFLYVIIRSYTDPSNVPLYRISTIESQLLRSNNDSGFCWIQI